MHDQEPIHALRQGSEQPNAAPFRKGGKCAMRCTGDEIDLSVTQGAIGTVDREDQFDLDVEPFALEKAKFGCRQCRELGVRDQVR
jgi:hypothetical protein